MQVEITSRHGHVNEDVRQYIREKSEKLVGIFERITAIQVTVDFQGAPIDVEILVDAEHKHNFVASTSNESIMPAFDATLHKMEQQIRRYKEKVQDHRRKSTGEASSETVELEND